MVICPICNLVMVVVNQATDTGFLFAEFNEENKVIRVARGSRVTCIECGNVVFEIQGNGIPYNAQKFWSACQELFTPGIQYFSFEVPIIKKDEE